MAISHAVKPARHLALSDGSSISGALGRGGSRIQLREQQGRKPAAVMPSIRRGSPTRGFAVQATLSKYSVDPKQVTFLDARRQDACGSAAQECLPVRLSAARRGPSRTLWGQNW